MKLSKKQKVAISYWYRRRRKKTKNPQTYWIHPIHELRHLLFVHYMLLFKTMFHFSRWSVKIRSKSVFIACMHLCMAPYIESNTLLMRLVSYFTFFRPKSWIIPTSVFLSADVDRQVVGRHFERCGLCKESLSPDKLSGDVVDRQTVGR
jgi:hypothetical protein